MCDAGLLRVSEVFLSIQGESSFAGLPCVMVRLSGCPLRCAFCDTRYAREEPGELLAAGEVLRRVSGLAVGPARLVELTGGEPLAQEASLPLLERLCDAGHQVLLETSGALDIAPVDPRVHIIMDYKCPSSGMTPRMHPGNLALLAAKDELKLVIAGREDYRFARDLLARHRPQDRCRCVLLSPAWGLQDPAELAAWMLEDRLDARLQLQLHKVIWGPERRGV